MVIKYQERVPLSSHKEIIGLTNYKKYGTVVVINHQFRLLSTIREKLLQMFPDATGIYQHITTIGERREPCLIFLEGTDNPEVIHKENGIFYGFNIKLITFSLGNSFLRIKLAKYLSQQDNLLDMFAAIGNLCIYPVVMSNCNLIAIEKNPTAYHYLQRNLKINKIEAKSYNIDCRKISFANWATVIFMGYYDVDFTHCKVAVKASKSYSKIFIQTLCVQKMEIRWKKLYTKWFTDLRCKILSLTSTKIKGYSPGLHHYQFALTLVKIK